MVRTTKVSCGLLLGVLASSSGCATSPNRYGPAETNLKLNRVVLYRNGVGYFERAGDLSGQVLSIRCRKDQINDVLKSLTVVDRNSGQALSVSMPLDPQRWASAAMAVLSPGNGNLAKVLDALRGTTVDLSVGAGTVSGRVLLVEPIVSDASDKGAPDHRVSLLDGEKVRVAVLSKVRGVHFRDGDVAVQLHRSLDASAGEGMFKQVTVSVRLAGAERHDLALSYVVSAPLWQPTYRLVLPEEGTGDALLQGWAVVTNTSGEDWRDVQISLTSGAPIAFKYDLHTPRDVERQDVTGRALSRRAEVAMGETSMEEAEAEETQARLPAPAAPAPDAPGGYRRPEKADKKSKERSKDVSRKGAPRRSSPMDPFGADDLAPAEAPPPPPSPVDQLRLEQSTRAVVKARTVSGMTRFDLQQRVTIPDGSATMVAVLNQRVPAEQVFLYKPGGSGAGYEQNPYRVVRFKNSTPFVLEPGPISIYSSGSFVGEGISEAIAAQTQATIPFAVEPGIVVSSSTEWKSGDVRIIRIQRGSLQLESFQRHVTKWTVRGQKQEKGYRVLVRQGKRGSGWELKQRPEGTEDLPDGYMIPIQVAGGKTEAVLEVVEQTPARSSITIWDSQAESALSTLLATTNLDQSARRKLQPILDIRREIGRIDTQLEGLRKQQQALDQRAQETRANLEAIKKDPRGGALRERLSQRLEEFTKEGDSIGRKVVELNSKRLELKINLDEQIGNLEFEGQ